MWPGGRIYAIPPGALLAAAGSHCCMAGLKTIHGLGVPPTDLLHDVLTVRCK